MSSKNYKVLSLDVSSTSTGWTFVNSKDMLLIFGKIMPDKKAHLPEKLTYFRKSIIALLKKYKPNNIVLEDTFEGRNPKVTNLLAKFGGVAEQTIFQYCKRVPYIMGNTTPKSFFKVRSKELLYEVIIDLKEDAFVNEDMNFKDYNDITDSIAQLLCYCHDILKIIKFKEEVEYGFRYNF